MLTNAPALITIALVVIATAAPPNLPRGKEEGGSYCNTGDLKCCNTIQSAEDPQTAKIAGLLDIPIEALTGNIGLGCVSVDLLLGLINPQACTQQPVCCERDEAVSLVHLISLS
ncbi:hypothetical protein V8B97DRAFT_1477060 [Scleroderma yunnanense]